MLGICQAARLAHWRDQKSYLHYNLSKDKGESEHYMDSITTYLALAALRGCACWTADERLVNQVNERLAFVKWLGDYVPNSRP